MRDHKFKSCLAQRMKSFIALKCLSGSHYKSQTLILSFFDRFLCKEKYRKHYLTKDIIEQYISTLSHLNPRYRSNQCSVIRQFSIYLSQFKPCCYVPEPIPAGKSYDSWRAYIFTEDQIQELLAATKYLRKSHWLRPHVMYTLIGLLYTTGIRIGEAKALNIEDFHPDTLRLLIREGKFRKARWIPLSVSTCDKLREYLLLRQKIICPGPEEPLFIGPNLTRLRKSYPGIAFNYLLKLCGIKKANKNGPRIHDLRHTFACHRLLAWYHEGQDVNARLPTLATYMGHLRISSTQIYIQATPELQNMVHHRFLKYVHDNNIIPGESNE